MSTRTSAPETPPVRRRSTAACASCSVVYARHSVAMAIPSSSWSAAPVGSALLGLVWPRCVSPVVDAGAPLAGPADSMLRPSPSSRRNGFGCPGDWSRHGPHDDTGTLRLPRHAGGLRDDDAVGR